MAQEISVPVRREEEMEEVNAGVEGNTWLEEIAWYAEEIVSIARYVVRACSDSPNAIGDSWIIGLFK